MADLEAPERFNLYCEHVVDLIPSKKGVKKAIARGELLLNGEKTEGGRWIKNGDRITLVDLELTPPKPYHLKLEIVHEDDDLALIIKPAGINVSGNQFKTIQNALLHNLTESAKPDRLPWPLPVHRLDNQTSGLLLIAKTKTARIELGKAFEERTIHKKYHAIVIGQMPQSGIMNTPVQGKTALSNYKSISLSNSLKNGFLSLVQLEPVTGRTHQLRIHCADLGFPILGDKLYGKPGLILKHKGLFLAATAITFPHPIDGKKCTFSIPIPQKFTKRLQNEERRFNAKNTSH